MLRTYWDHWVRFDGMWTSTTGEPEEGRDGQGLCSLEGESLGHSTR